jgi:hypothetical protein
LAVAAVKATAGLLVLAALAAAQILLVQVAQELRDKVLQGQRGLVAQAVAAAAAQEQRQLLLTVLQVLHQQLAERLFITQVVVAAQTKAGITEGQGELAAAQRVRVQLELTALQILVAAAVQLAIRLRAAQAAQAS